MKWKVPGVPSPEEIRRQSQEDKRFSVVKKSASKKAAKKKATISSASLPYDKGVQINFDRYVASQKTTQAWKQAYASQLGQFGGGSMAISKISPQPRPPHRFRVGDYVEVIGYREDFEVHDVHPHRPEYRVKNTRDGTFRVVSENQLRPSRRGVSQMQTVSGHMTFSNQFNGVMSMLSTDTDDKPEKVEKPKPKPKVKFESVLLPEEKKQAILDAVSQVDNHDLIFEKWGFAEKFEKGTAVSMLFYGPPGTGKTMIAQAVADKYDKKLKIIGTAEIESSEPGQAERNIKAYFEESGDDTVLLFDECDSLIADRTKVGMILGAQINALLTCLERYKGIVLFTTNRLEALDPAFERRLSLKLEFEMPTPEIRKQIWLNFFPKKAPLDDKIDWDTISEIEIAGGNIKNVVLKAARIAANQKLKKDQKITQRIITNCLLEELASMQAFDEALKTNKTPGLVSYGHSNGGIQKSRVVERSTRP